MKAFLVGLIFLTAVAVFAGIGILLFPLLIAMTWVLRFILLFIFIFFVIWLLGKLIIFLLGRMK